ncbi:hypothetical protein GW17_00009846 [Ensete ventricosum]|nr:hypothetical protein GW17_00009846 [Ensete ventricosum]
MQSLVQRLRSSLHEAQGEFPSIVLFLRPVAQGEQDGDEKLRYANTQGSSVVTLPDILCSKDLSYLIYSR